MIKSPNQHARAWSQELSIEQHVAVQANDTEWMDQAVSDYVFNSGNESREEAYRLALHASYFGSSALMRKLIEEAVWEKAEKEIKSFVLDYDDAA